MTIAGLITIMVLHFEGYHVSAPFDSEQECSERLLRHHLAYQGDDDYLFGQCIATGAPSRSDFPIARIENAD